MSAHDSTLSAHVKQTRDANHKQWVAPFQQGKMVYFSSKNIHFSKGLACKLIPKFIVPYKILDYFRNLSFRLDLPSHLKQWGYMMYFMHHYLGSIYLMTINYFLVKWIHKYGILQTLKASGQSSDFYCTQDQALTLFLR